MNHEVPDHDQKCTAYGFGPGQRMDICICTGIRIGRAQTRREVLADLRARVLDLPKGRDRESGLWCIEVDVLLALLEEKP